MKLSASKIFHETYSDGSKSVIVIAGDVMYARMGMQAIESGIKAIPAAKRTTLGMAKIVRDTVRTLHHGYLFPHPDKPEVQYLIGLWSPSGGLKLLTTQDTAVNELRGYDCVGAGAYLAHYLIRSLYQESDKDFDEVLTIAINALQRIKSYDDACGGDSEFVKLMATGEMSSVETYQITIAEQQSADIDEAVSDLLLAISRPSATSESAESALKTFDSSMQILIQRMKVSETIQSFSKKLESPGPAFTDQVNKVFKKMQQRRERKKLSETKTRDAKRGLP